MGQHVTIKSVVDPSVQRVDFFPQLLRIEVDRGLVGRHEVIELTVEDADDLRALIVHNGIRLLVP